MGHSVNLVLDQGQMIIVKFGREVIKGCYLSPSLLNFYSECPTKEDLDRFGDFRIVGKVMCTAKCTDGLVLLAKEETVLQGVKGELIETGRCYGVKINVERTKEITIPTQPSPIQITKEYQQPENVEYFNYFGSSITNDARCAHKLNLGLS